MRGVVVNIMCSVVLDRRKGVAFKGLPLIEEIIDSVVIELRRILKDC